MKKAFLAVFLGILVLVPVLVFSLPREAGLTPGALPPEWSGESLLDGSAQSQAEAWLADNLPARRALTAAQTALELAAGRREIGGVYIAKDRLMEDVAPPDDTQTIRNVRAINDFAARHPEQAVFFALVPTAAQVYADEAPNFATPYDQSDYISTLYGAMQNVKTIGLLEPLLAKRASYLYYRTDSCWTSYGAFVGYTALAKPLGFNAVSYDLFNIEHAAYDFLGALCQKARVGAPLRDNIDLYEYSQGNVIRDVVRHEGSRRVSEPSVLFRDRLNSRNPLSVFLGPSAPVVDVNTSAEPARRLLIFGDGFAKPLVQFLPLHYGKITFVDLRLLSIPLSDYLALDDYTQVLFLYGVDGFAASPSLPKINQY